MKKVLTDSTEDTLQTTKLELTHTHTHTGPGFGWVSKELFKLSLLKRSICCRGNGTVPGKSSASNRSQPPFV